MPDDPAYRSDRDQALATMAGDWSPPGVDLADLEEPPGGGTLADLMAEEPPPDGIGFWLDETDGYLYDDGGEILELDSDGNVYDRDGRKLGHVSEVDKADKGFSGPNFQVTNREEAEWALGRRADVEASIVALQARLDAHRRNLQSQIDEQKRRLRWWDYRFESGVIGVARSLLKGKGKTAVLDNGRVAFRTAPPSTVIIDEAAAVSWAIKWAPAIVKEKIWVTATDVKKAKLEVEADTETPQVLPFLATSEARESITIRTGIKQEG